MIILGLTKQQTYVLKHLKLGDGYLVIASYLGISASDVLFEEEEALFILTQRWRLREVDVRRIIATMFLIVLSVTPIFNGNMEVNRAIRGRSSLATIRNKESVNNDLILIDV